MPQTLDLQNLEKDSRGVFSEDGLLYVFCGLLLLLIGASFAVPALLPLVGFSALLIYPVEALRRRITYPRIGYARFSAPSGTVRGILGFTIVSVIALCILAFFDGGRFQRYLPMAISIVFALAFYFGMSTHGVRPGDWFIIIVTLCAGFFATWRYDDWHDGAAALLGFVGLFLLVFGVIKLARFLRNYPYLEHGDPE
jgi:hypothetical protein